MISTNFRLNGFLGPDYMGVVWLGRRAGSFAKMEFRLLSYLERAATRG